MRGGVLVGTDWREIQVSSHTFQSRNKQFDVVTLQIIDQILEAGDGPLILYEFKFGELTNVLKITTAFIVDDEICVYIFPQFFVIGEEGLKDCLLDVAVVDCHYGCDAA